MHLAQASLLALAACVARPPGNLPTTSADGVAGTETATPVDVAWLAITSGYQGAARFVTVYRSGDILAAETSSPNLETATLTALRQGRLAPDNTDALFEELAEADWQALNTALSDELIDDRHPLIELGSSTAGLARTPRTLFIESLPPSLASRIAEVLVAVTNLDLAPPGALLRASRMASDRAERVRGDPRALYRFLGLDAETLNSTAGLAAAIANPGAVFFVPDDEADRLAGWLLESNPQGLGDAFFVESAGAARPDEWQVHFKRWGRAVP